MPACRFGEIVRNLRGRAQLDRGKKLVASKGIQPRNEQRAQSTIRITLRNSGNSKLCGDSVGVGVGLKTRGRNAIVARPHFIDERTREQMRLTHYCVNRLSFLIPSRERSPIRNPAERARNKCWVIYVTHTPEDAVLLTEVVVHANIKLIGVVAQFWVCGVVVEEAWKVGGGIEVQKFDRVGVEPARGKDVAGKGLANKAELSSGRHSCAGRSDPRDRVRNSAGHRSCRGGIEDLT